MAELEATKIGLETQQQQQEQLLREEHQRLEELEQRRNRLQQELEVCSTHPLHVIELLK